MTTGRRRRAWADVLYTDLALPSGGSIITNLLVGSGAPVVDTLTSVRIIVGVDVYSDDINENEYMQAVDLGIGVSSAEAFATGVTALPDPNTAGDYPPRGWIFVERRTAMQSLPTGGTPTAMWRMNPRFEVDLGAMRRIDKGVLFAIWRSAQGGATAQTLNLNGRIRTLCLT